MGRCFLAGPLCFSGDGAVDRVSGTGVQQALHVANHWSGTQKIMAHVAYGGDLRPDTLRCGSTARSSCFLGPLLPHRSGAAAAATSGRASCLA